MPSRPTSQTIVLLALGAGLGYLAAAGDIFHGTRVARAPGPRPECGGKPRGRVPAVSCSDGGREGRALRRCAGEPAWRKLRRRVAANKPNILVIFGDDIGISNISGYSDGLMGYDNAQHRPHRQGRHSFLHYYGEQSCTAGRAAFLTGQHGIRTGLTKVGFPGARWA